MAHTVQYAPSRKWIALRGPIAPIPICPSRALLVNTVLPGPLRPLPVVPAFIVQTPPPYSTALPACTALRGPQPASYAPRVPTVQQSQTSQFAHWASIVPLVPRPLLFVRRVPTARPLRPSPSAHQANTVPLVPRRLLFVLPACILRVLALQCVLCALRAPIARPLAWQPVRPVWLVSTRP